MLLSSLIRDQWWERERSQQNDRGCLQHFFFLLKKTLQDKIKVDRSAAVTIGLCARCSVGFPLHSGSVSFYFHLHIQTSKKFPLLWSCDIRTLMLHLFIKIHHHIISVHILLELHLKAWCCEATGQQSIRKNLHLCVFLPGANTLYVIKIFSLTSAPCRTVCVMLKSREDMMTPCFWRGTLESQEHPPERRTSWS